MATMSEQLSQIDPDQPQTVDIMLQACREGNLEKVRNILSENPDSASQQVDSTGRSPLMEAAEKGNLELCQVLLDHGAPWNAIDRYGQCAGNYATNAEFWEVVDLLVDAGTRAELILGASIRLQRKQQTEDKRGFDDCETETVSTGESSEGRPVEHEPCSKPDYLRQRLEYSADGNSLLDSDKDAVMMEWERPLMEAHASILMEGPRKRVLNVGFGMGIIDSALQELDPSLHIIIEAHPDVYKRILRDEWNQKPNVRVCFGTWQEIVPMLIQEGVVVDAIFYDTYGEHFLDLEDFHMSMVNLLSKPHGVYSFFNGLAPDNIFFHGVACQCVKLQLGHLGLDTEFIPCKIQVPSDRDWEGVRRKYWHGRDIYYLPRASWNAEFLSKTSRSPVPAENSLKQSADTDVAPKDVKRPKII